MVKLEVGKYYKTRDGRKVGPMRRYENSSCQWDITDDDNDWQNYLIYGSHGESLDQCTVTDIVSEWVDYSSCEAAQVDVQREEYGPIRTRREIVPGQYGRVKVENGSPFACIVGMKPAALNAEELREAAHLFNQLAEVLDDNRA